MASTASLNRIRIPTFQSPTSQAKAPDARAQSRAEERAARIKVQGNITWASLSLLAEGGPENLSHLLTSRNVDSDGVYEEQRLDQATREATRSTAFGGDDSRFAMEVPLKPERASSSLQRAAGERDDKPAETAHAADTDNYTRAEQGDRGVSSGVESAAARSRSSHSRNNPTLARPEQVLSPVHQPLAPPPRARRPRAAVLAESAVATAQGSRPGDVATEDRPAGERRQLPRPLDEASSTQATTSHSTIEADASQPPGKRVRTPESPDIAPANAPSADDYKPKKRTRVRPAARTELVPGSDSLPSRRRLPDTDTNQARLASDRSGQREDPASLVSSKRVSQDKPSRVEDDQIGLAATARYMDRLSPVPDHPSATGEPAFVKIRTERCDAHAPSCGLNAYDVIAGAIMKLNAQARLLTSSNSAKEIYADFTAFLQQKAMYRALLLSGIASAAYRIGRADQVLHEVEQ